MIVVVGRPAIQASSAPGPADDASARPSGLVASIAVAAAAAGARVELVGTIGDDDDGDALTVALSRAGVGHAALLRDPVAKTPRAENRPESEEPAGESVAGQDTESAAEQDAQPDAERAAGPDATVALALGPHQSAPRLEAADVELGLRYHADYRVLVIGEPVPDDAMRVALDAASYQGAAVIAIVPQGAQVSDRLGAAGTLLEAPADGDAAFAQLVGRYAAGLDAGQEPQTAFAAARRATGWETGQA